MRMNTGFMIVCEGSNGAGKSSLIKALEQHFLSKGIEVILTREPGGTAIGERIREILLCANAIEMCDITELMLFAAARAQHVKEKIIPAIDAGKIVISDRFDPSTFSFQHYARGLSYDLIAQINELALDGFKPDLNIVLDLDPNIGLERVNSRGEGLDRLEDEDIEFLHRARNGYLQQAKNDPQHFSVIDASKSQVEVIAEAIQLVDHLIDKRMGNM